jgi:hypothetical protein
MDLWKFNLDIYSFNALRRSRFEFEDTIERDGPWRTEAPRTLVTPQFQTFSRVWARSCSLAVFMVTLCNNLRFRVHDTSNRHGKLFAVSGLFDMLQVCSQLVHAASPRSMMLQSLSLIWISTLTRLSFSYSERAFLLYQPQILMRLDADTWLFLLQPEARAAVLSLLRTLQLRHAQGMFANLRTSFLGMEQVLQLLAHVLPFWALFSAQLLFPLSLFIEAVQTTLAAIK